MFLGVDHAHDGDILAIGRGGIGAVRPHGDPQAVAGHVYRPHGEAAAARHGEDVGRGPAVPDVERDAGARDKRER